MVCKNRMCYTCNSNDDTLECIFDQQKELQLLAGNGNLPRLDGDLVAQFWLGMITELGEVLQVYKGWKPWKNSDNYTYEEQKVREELADVWHFLVNLTLSLGYSANDVEMFFNEKHNKILNERFSEEGVTLWS